MHFRLLDTGKNNAFMNMAIDEALLNSKLPVLRFYQWQPPAISIGFSQKMREEINIKECKKRGIDYVRRITGGKAVLHDMELTYSIIIDAKLMPKTILESYKLISKGIILALKKVGIHAQMKEAINKSEKMRGNAEHFFTSICFNEPSYYEITVDDKKVVGSAQVRKNNKVLQHGSALMDIDIEKLCSLFNVIDKGIINKTRNRITSISEILGRKVLYEEVADAMKFGFRKNFKCNLLPDKLTTKEIQLAEKLAKEKYSTDDWNFRR